MTADDGSRKPLHISEVIPLVLDEILKNAEVKSGKEQIPGVSDLPRENTVRPTLHPIKEGAEGHILGSPDVLLEQ